MPKGSFPVWPVLWRLDRETPQDAGGLGLTRNGNHLHFDVDAPSFFPVSPRQRSKRKERFSPLPQRPRQDLQHCRFLLISPFQFTKLNRPLYVLYHHVASAISRVPTRVYLLLLPFCVVLLLNSRRLLGKAAFRTVCPRRLFLFFLFVFRLHIRISIFFSIHWIGTVLVTTLPGSCTRISISRPRRPCL